MLPRSSIERDVNSNSNVFVHLTVYLIDLVVILNVAETKHTCISALETVLGIPNS